MNAREPLQRPANRSFAESDIETVVPGVLADLIELERDFDGPLTERIIGLVIQEHVWQPNKAFTVRKYLRENELWDRVAKHGKPVAFFVNGKGKVVADPGFAKCDAAKRREIIALGTAEIVKKKKKEEEEREKEVTLDDFPDEPTDEELPPEDENL